MIKEISVKSGSRIELIDISSEVQSAVSASGVKNGICHLYVPHTTAAVTINEAADPSVASDIERTLAKLVPEGDRSYRHTEGNSDAHIKSSMIGITEEVFVERGKLVLGTWQGIFFCEFDGPRTRRVLIKMIPTE
jgi:secondary thiamine-phosphate synthase enzyme